jgi:hypothetical protein
LLISLDRCPRRKRGFCDSRAETAGRVKAQIELDSMAMRRWRMGMFTKLAPLPPFFRSEFVPRLSCDAARCFGGGSASGVESIYTRLFALICRYLVKQSQSISPRSHVMVAKRCVGVVEYRRTRVQLSGVLCDMYQLPKWRD